MAAAGGCRRRADPGGRRLPLASGVRLSARGRSAAETGIRPIALAAITWSLAFAAIHVAWALGSTAGLDGRRVTGLLLAIDIVAIPLCLLAAWVAWRLRHRHRHRARRAPPIIHRMAWAAAVVLGLRGLGTIQALVAPTDDATVLTRLVDPYFLLGGVLFGVLAWTAAAVRSIPHTRPS